MKRKVISRIVIMERNKTLVAQDTKLSTVFSDAEKQTKLMLVEIPKAKTAGSAATNGVTPEKCRSGIGFTKDAGQ